MHPDVLAILTADEEARQLVVAAQTRLEADLASARLAAAAEREAAERRATRQLQEELGRVDDEHARRRQARVADRAARCEARAAAARDALDGATDLFMRIVRTGEGVP